MTAPTPTDTSPDTDRRPMPEPERIQGNRGTAAELIAREVAFEAMKRLIRSGGDADRLSQLGRAALAWAGAEPDDRDSYLDAPDPGGGDGRSTRFVQNGDGHVWVTVPILKVRGWTDAAIRDFLPEHDGLKPNPRLGEQGPPMRVWLAETVAEAEASPEWTAWLRRSLRRRGKTMQDLKASLGDNFRRRVDAVQEAIDSYLEAQITRRPTPRREVVAAD